jgi:hypothetical protein
MLRLPRDIRRRIEAHMVRLGRQRPGAGITRSGVIRELLVLALDTVERQAREG